VRLRAVRGRRAERRRGHVSEGAVLLGADARVAGHSPSAVQPVVKQLVASAGGSKS